MYVYQFTLPARGPHLRALAHFFSTFAEIPLVKSQSHKLTGLDNPASEVAHIPMWMMYFPLRQTLVSTAGFKG